VRRANVPLTPDDVVLLKDRRLEPVIFEVSCRH
jgi:hypothetical protein